MSQKVVTRFAPSPTGFMHIGGVRTALYAWLFARKHNGTFILRIEDTDKKREVEGSIDHIIASLKWLGISWDEGPDIGGSHAPYLQSQRLDSYKKYAQILIDKGFAYADPYTEAELEKFRADAEASKQPFLYRNYRPENPPVWDGSQPLRFKVKDIKTYEWNDLVRGTLSAGPEALDDIILIKSDGYPTYNFAHIIDDLEMGVTHIMRADEFISSTPKFLCIYEALGIQRPEIATLPPIMGPEGKKKLSKRDGAKDILDYKNEGYLPEAIMNFLIFIGWNPGGERELYTAEELMQEFDISKIHSSGGKFNEDKLNWFNREYIKKLDQSGFWTNGEKWVPQWVYDIDTKYEMLAKIEFLIRDRIEKFSDIKTLFESGEFDYFFKEPVIDDIQNMIWKSLRDTADGKEKTKTYLTQAKNLLETISESDWSETKVKELIWPLTETYGRGELLWPIRYSLSGRDKSPDPFVLAGILGKDTTVKRLTTAISLL